MADLNDMDLMRDYAERNSEAAFAELVRRHINLVYSVALRYTDNSADAQDVTQTVFIVLVQKAASLCQRTTLTGWLYETTRLVARQRLRTRTRQQIRDQEAYMQSALNEADTDSVWKQLAPLLEEGMTRLNENERTLLALRFFENKSAAETATLLGIQEWAAHKRVTRAVEKLRTFFAKRGVALSAAVLTTAIAAHSVQAAPAGLAAAMTTAALSGATFTTTAVIAATKTIAMTILQKTLVTVVVAALAGAGIYETRQAAQLREQNQTLQQAQAPLADKYQQLQRERDAATNRLASMAEEMANTKSNNEELLKLRGEVGVLQRQASESSQRVHIAEQNLATALSSKAQFEAHQSATAGGMKQVGLAIRIFSTDHDNQFPTNLVQLKKELGGSFEIGGISLFSFELTNIGAERLDHPNMVELRERLAHQAPDGTWERIYGFADGSVHTAKSNDGNFEAWEKANTYLAPPTQN